MPAKPAVSILALIIALAHLASAQSVAVIAPDGSKASTDFAASLAEALRGKARVMDTDAAMSAYSSSPPENPFNLPSAEAARLGTVIGSDAVVVVRSATQRRSSSERPEYYETYAIIFAFGSRSGMLLAWDAPRSEAATPAESQRLFRREIDSIASRLAGTIKDGVQSEITAAAPPRIPDAADFEKTADFRAPVPYKRVKPAYTEIAFLYDVRATVDVVVYLDEKGEIVRTDVARWAGFGLEESVIKNIRSMNWRPATIAGKSLATRFLIRYNFKKGD